MASKVDFVRGFGKVIADNPKVWEFDRALSVGASEVFGCMRHARYKKFHADLAGTIEEDPSDTEWGHTTRGDVVENKFAVPCLEGMFGKKNCLYMGDKQKTFVEGKLSATPDGLVINQPSDVLALYGIPAIESGEISTEVKSFGGEYAAPKRLRNPNGTLTYEAKPRHVGQVIVQMGLIRRQTPYKPSHGAVLYINPVNLKDIRPAIVEYDDAIYNKGIERADRVFSDEPLVSLPAEGRYLNECQYCAFKDNCDSLDLNRYTNAAVPQDELSYDDLRTARELTIDVDRLKKDYKKVEEEKKKKEQQLRAMLLDIGTNRLGEEDLWAVSLSKVSGKKSLNKELMIEDGIDLSKYETYGAAYFRMNTKVL